MRSAVIWKSLDRISGIFKHIIIAAAIGLSGQLDIFYMTMALMGVFVFTWAQLLEVMAVPKLVELNKSEDKKPFTSLASGLFTLSLLFSIILAIILLLGRNGWSHVAWGFDSERKSHLAEAFIWFSPVIIFYIPLNFIGSVFRAVRKFTIFYQAEFIIAIVSLSLIFFFKDSSNVLLWSFSVGTLVAFFYIFISFLHNFKAFGNPLSRDVLTVLRIAPGLLILQCAHYLYILTDRVFISFLGSGCLGALAYGRTLAFFIEGIMGIKKSFITIFSEATENNKKNEIYNNLISLAVYISIPLTIFLLFFGVDIISIFLERGMFTSSDTRLVNLSLSGFCWSLLPMVLQVPMEQIFQVHGKIDLMVRRKILGLITNVVLNSFFLFVLKWGIWGIALATSLSYWVVTLYSIHAAVRLRLILVYQRHFKWMFWMASGSFMAAFAVQKAGMYTICK